MFTKLIDALKATRRTIVFTEGPDARILEATDRLLKDDLMDVILIGNVDEVKAAAEKGNFCICKATIIDPATYEGMDEMVAKMVELRKGKMTAEDCAKGLNRMIENYNSGIQITYKLYTDEEIAAVPTRQKAEIYYFPGSDPGGKFVLVIGGNAIHTSAEMREGVSTAEWLNELGYTCFVLRYRIGDQAADNAPLEDVSRAVRYITEHAEQFHVQPEDYAVLAYSSGGQIAGLFASDSDTLGHKAYGVSKPGALLLGYPVNNFFELKPVWGLLIDPYADGPRYFDYNVSDYITPDYPPVYHWYGKNDVTLAKMYTPAQGRVIEKALVKNGVPHIFHHYHNAPHKIGPGRGTDAEGWITEAVAFWESQTAAKAADTAA